MHTRWHIEPRESEDCDPCPCCGEITRVVTGVVRCDHEQFAMYAVRWMLGHVAEHGARFELILNAWRADSGRVECCAVSLLYRLIDDRPGFMVVDAMDCETTHDLRPLRRADVIGDPLAEDVFLVCDVIIGQDERIAELFHKSSYHVELH